MSPYHRVKSMTLTVLQSLPENSVLFRESKRKKEPFEKFVTSKIFHLTSYRKCGCSVKLQP